jgi:hypothetical protein
MNAEDQALHEQHTEFAGGLFDLIRTLYGHLATGAPITPEILRSRVAALIPARTSELGSLPIRRVIEDIDRIVAIRDGASGSDRSALTH